MSKQDEAEKIMSEVLGLTQSSLYEERVTNGWLPVLGEGSLDARVMFVGEAPGKNEAKTGKPFCGASGKVLDKLLSVAGLAREDVYVTSIVKDRPTDNRDPKPEEIALYAPFLLRQIEQIQPQVIATLGRFSMDFILRNYGLENEIDKISEIHGKAFKTHATYGEIVIIPLFHPAVALYAGSKMTELKEDMKVLKNILKKV